MWTSACPLPTFLCPHSYPPRPRGQHHTGDASKVRARTCRSLRGTSRGKPMISVLFVAVISFLLSLALTRLVRDASTRLGLVDLPDYRRKTHHLPVPRTGGVAIVAAY